MVKKSVKTTAAWLKIGQIFAKFALYISPSFPVATERRPSFPTQCG
jgi:hypothetical protein